MNSVLLVDDEPAICWSVREALTDRGMTVESAGSIAQAWELLETFDPSVILLDVRLPGQDGLSALPEFKQRYPHVPLIVMTAFGDLPTAVSAFSQNVFEYVTKPFDLTQFSNTVERAISRTSIASPWEEPESRGGSLVGQSAAMQEVFRQVALVAQTEFPVLILGETGTGKEVVARELHRYSRRQNEAFVTVCPAALNPSLVESEFFGHVRGAFTGAVAYRAGLFELANLGTVFLDEIGDTPLETQVKLLRVLESKLYRPVGSGTEQSTGARVIAATNRDLSQMVAEGTFREDLLHRLMTFAIRLPPLRNRVEDIRPLAESFIAGCDESLKPSGIEESFWKALETRAWHGNVRELKRATEHAIVLARQGVLRAGHLPEPFHSSPQAGQEQTEQRLLSACVDWARNELAKIPIEASGDLHERFLQVVESGLFREVLEMTGQNRTLAARVLGLDRTTLRNRLKQLSADSQIET